MPACCPEISRRIPKLAAVCILLFFATLLRAQVPFTKEFFLNESGIPVKVNDLFSDASGYLWLATDNGLYRFNGRSFTLIPDSIRQPATALTEHKGQLYIGYRNGSLGFVENGIVITYKPRYKSPGSSITSLKTKGEFLWITTEDEGLFFVANDVGYQLSTADGLVDNFIYDAFIAPDEVMIATDRGINHIRLSGKKIYTELFSTSQGLPDNIVRVLRSVPGTNICWVGTQEGGVAIYDDTHETIRRFKMDYPWAWGQVNDVLPVSKTSAWVATEEGYLLWATVSADSLEITPYRNEGVKIKKLIKDKAGNIWCATNKGLMMSTAEYARHLRLGFGYHLNDLTAMTCDHGNTIWYTQNNQLWQLAPGVSMQPRLRVTAPAAITCLYATEDSAIWIGTFGKGLFRFREGKLVSVDNVEQLRQGHILSIAAHGGKLWISSLNGVEETVVPRPFRGKLQYVRHHNKMSGTGSDYVYQLYIDRKGRTWMATDGGGVCLVDNGRYRRWDSASGLTSAVVYTVAEDASGDIWAGALEKGLFRLRDNRWTNVRETYGLLNRNITAIRGNATGQVVVVHEEGVDQWCPASSQFRHYNRRLGMDIDSTSGKLNAIANDGEGNVYVPFEHGFLLFRNMDQVYDIRPGIRINSVSLFLKTLKAEKHSFSHNENHISFRFDGINFSNPDKLHYRYKLEGYDNNWIYTNDELVSFPQLPAGRGYVFRVQSSLNNYFMNASEDSFRFTIIKPFWKRAWFVALIALALLGTGYAYVRIREHSLRKMSRLQRERMMFEYEHLKSQVNPHFLFNSLNTLVSLIEDDQEAAVDYTVHLSDLYRNMLSYKDRDLIFLWEEFEIIMNYMHIQKSRFGEALRLETDVPEALMKTKRIVPLALQLLVENAIKHNVVSLSKPLTIFIIADKEQLSVKNKVQPKLSKEKGAGLGIVNIKNRYSLLTSRSIQYGFEDEEYIVILPLL